MVVIWILINFDKSTDSEDNDDNISLEKVNLLLEGFQKDKVIISDKNMIYEECINCLESISEKINKKIINKKKKMMKWIYHGINLKKINKILNIFFPKLFATRKNIF